MNYVRIGYQRDRRILQLIEDLQALNTRQIAALEFRSPAGYRKAQERLKKLVDRGLLKKPFRMSLDTPNIYFVGKKSGRLEHLIDCNWIYVWLKACRELREWRSEVKLDLLQADALARITGGWYFVEMDLAEHRNPWDKVDKYNALYESQGYAGSNLMQVLGNPRKWPGIIVITTDLKRAEKIAATIEKQDRNKLNWQLHLLERIRREAEFHDSSRIQVSRSAR